MVSVHDVSFLEHPEYFPRFRALQLRWTVRRTVQSAAQDSDAERIFARRHSAGLRRDPDEVVVAPLAAAPEFRTLHIDNALDAVRTRFQLPAPFILSVGDLQPRKNQIGLIGAFADLVRTLSAASPPAGAGRQGDLVRGQGARSGRRPACADRIRFLGFVSDQDLLHLYNACDLFVFPSFYEGFGLPVLEAMACGRAVVCSNTSAMPEVVDGAAILFDPYSMDEMTRAMADLLLDAELRARMERLGLQRAAHFSWQETAQRTLDVYYAVAEGGRAEPAPAGSRFHYPADDPSRGSPALYCWRPARWRRPPGSL